MRAQYSEGCAPLDVDPFPGPYANSHHGASKGVGIALIGYTEVYTRLVAKQEGTVRPSGSPAFA
jgi:hypothetical protein